MTDLDALVGELPLNPKLLKSRGYFENLPEPLVNTLLKHTKTGRIKELGKGASRVTYDVGGGNVLKIAMNQSGILQNRSEVIVHQKYGSLGYTATVFRWDPKFQWVIMERVEPVYSRAPWDGDIPNANRDCEAWFTSREYFQSVDGNPMSPVFQDCLKGAHPTGEQRRLRDFLEKTGLDFQDLNRQMGKTRDGRLVFYDFGFDRATRNFWHKRDMKDREKAGKSAGTFEARYPRLTSLLKEEEGKTRSTALPPGVRRSLRKWDPSEHEEGDWGWGWESELDPAFVNTLRKHIKSGNLTFLGEGSSRATFSVGGGAVLKVAMNKYGVTQNRSEIAIWKRFGRNSEFLPRVFRFDPSGKWIVAEEVEEVGGRSDMGDLGVLFLADVGSWVDDYLQGWDPDGVEESFLEQLPPVAQRFLRFAKQAGLVWGDVYPGHFGRTKDGRIVLYDSGLSEVF